jgi:hypothetical protein
VKGASGGAYGCADRCPRSRRQVMSGMSRAESRQTWFTLQPASSSSRLRSELRSASPTAYRCGCKNFTALDRCLAEEPGTYVLAGAPPDCDAPDFEKCSRNRGA